MARFSYLCGALLVVAAMPVTAQTMTPQTTPSQTPNTTMSTPTPPMQVPAQAQPTVDAAAPANAAAPTAPGSNLTDKEQKQLTKCQAMDPQRQAQSSKCSKIMEKAGMKDPAKQMMTPSNS